MLPIAVALVLTAYLVTHRPGPTRKPVSESIRTLRVIEVPYVDLVPKATGYGVAQAGRVWEAVAEVKGIVLSVFPHLKSGVHVKANDILIRIDPTEYELTVARLEAGVEKTQAEIKELSGDEENTKRLLAVEQRSLALARLSLERKRGALKRNAISHDEVDVEERNFLLQKKTVQELENSLSLIPSKREALHAALAVNQADLQQAGIDLAKTTIRAPFDCRLGDVNIETGQFVRADQSLFKAQSTAVTEVEARFQADTLRNLLSGRQRTSFQPGLDTAAFKQLFHEVKVLISLQSGDWSAQWEARIDRVREAVDVKTREIKVVAAVDHPYDKAVLGVRPPLTSGMFCEVELRAPMRPKSIILPRSALHKNSVFVIDEQHRLQKKQVLVDFAQSEFIVIKSGLSGNETIVVSDPSPAITGMRVSPVTDDRLRQHLLDISREKKDNE